MKKLKLLLAVPFAASSPTYARNLLATLAEPPSSVLQTTNSPDLKFCVITAIANRTGQASTVVERGRDTVIAVHNWSSPVPGDDVRAVFTVKPDGQIEFRGQKQELIRELDRCKSL